ncbi:hypothetical protein Tco_0821260 [Tanacetum coccineum]|uniref:Reverse transcriptase domain-containing protein n=1 Tax=Tanacetum coccineum TaxID=301880 RepID=A0ABQ5AFZ7_9ASTR
MISMILRLVFLPWRGVTDWAIVFHDDVGVPDAAADDNAKAMSVCDDIDQADAAAYDNAKVVELWVQLMWLFRPKHADWAIFSPYYFNLPTPNDLGDWIFKDITHGAIRYGLAYLMSMGTMRHRALKHVVPFIYELWVPTMKYASMVYVGYDSRHTQIDLSALNLEKAECSNCIFLAKKMKALKTKIKILEATLEMERHPEKARNTHDRKHNGNVKCQDDEQISMPELEYRIEKHYDRTEGAVGLCHWFKKMESTFEISECAKGRKVKFATTTLHGQALTWWNS